MGRAGLTALSPRGGTVERSGAQAAAAGMQHEGQSVAKQRPRALSRGRRGPKGERWSLQDERPALSVWRRGLRSAGGSSPSRRGDGQEEGVGTRRRVAGVSICARKGEAGAQDGQDLLVHQELPAASQAPGCRTGTRTAEAAGCPGSPGCLGDGGEARAVGMNLTPLPGGESQAAGLCSGEDGVHCQSHTGSLLSYAPRASCPE